MRRRVWAAAPTRSTGCARAWSAEGEGRREGDELLQFQEAGINVYKYLEQAGLITQKDLEAELRRRLSRPFRRTVCALEPRRERHKCACSVSATGASPTRTRVALFTCDLASRPLRSGHSRSAQRTRHATREVSRRTSTEAGPGCGDTLQYELYATSLAAGVGSDAGRGPARPFVRRRPRCVLAAVTPVDACTARHCVLDLVIPAQSRARRRGSPEGNGDGGPGPHQYSSWRRSQNSVAPSSSRPFATRSSSG